MRIQLLEAINGEEDVVMSLHIRVPPALVDRPTVLQLDIYFCKYTNLKTQQGNLLLHLLCSTTNTSEKYERTQQGNLLSFVPPQRVNNCVLTKPTIEVYTIHSPHQMDENFSIDQK